MRLSKYRIENWTWVGPEDTLAGVLRGPKLQALNDCSLDGDGPAVFAGTEAEIRGGQPVELFFDDLDGAPAHVEAEGALHESREAVFELNVGRLRAQGLGVQVVEDKPGFRPEGQAHVHEILGCRIEETTGLKLQPDHAVLALP